MDEVVLDDIDATGIEAVDGAVVKLVINMAGIKDRPRLPHAIERGFHVDIDFESRRVATGDRPGCLIRLDQYRVAAGDPENPLTALDLNGLLDDLQTKIETIIARVQAGVGQRLDQMPLDRPIEIGIGGPYRAVYRATERWFETVSATHGIFERSANAAQVQRNNAIVGPRYEIPPAQLRYA